mmetsp:Transcript_29654/g.55584  ORF Transcript_29654/g.55584 Transcript_29654/m.55584 type:complete len:95 (+) Transcript_29654:210-494(+)
MSREIPSSILQLVGANTLGRLHCCYWDGMGWDVIVVMEKEFKSAVCPKLVVHRGSIQNCSSFLSSPVQCSTALGCHGRPPGEKRSSLLYVPPIH